MAASAQLLLSDPVPVLLIELDAGDSKFRPKLDVFDRTFAQLLPPNVLDVELLWECRFRADSLDRLQTILTTGIDVEPSDAVIYADFFDKALEYGGWPKVVMALRQGGLQRTFRKIAADTPADQISELRRTYPTMLTSVDGQRLWLSRLPTEDPRVTTPYEADYAFWIPGRALDTLAGVFVLVRPNEGAGVADVVASLNTVC